MSKSYKKTPIFKIACCRSEKKDKRLANRKFRSIEKQLTKLDIDIFPIMRELINVWDFGGDGKQYWKEYKRKDMRK